ncbi:MAG: hypothetical protein QOF40_2074 [Actinomycetota bacterium]|nr:hypothetical protein [Actinomycetota bacterium]
MAAELTVRRAGPDDFPGVLDLARRALGWTDDDAGFLEWKHLENPFGVSPMWIALDAYRIVGFRTFLRWDFVTTRGDTVLAARAVDTATDPDHQGRGIFTPPNEKSLPGYLKMGWHELGRLGVVVKPSSTRFVVVIATARRAAGRWPLATVAGTSPADAFADRSALQTLLESLPRADGLATRRTPEFLAWRYGYEPLGYRVVLRGDSPADGLAVFRRRRRGKAVEGVLCELLAPEGDARATAELLRQVDQAADADYLIQLHKKLVTRGPFVRLPRVGPVLACRPLDASPALELPGWALTMGDVELF